MENSIPSTGLVLLVHPLELSSACIRKNLFILKSWTHAIELDIEMFLSDNLNSFDIGHHQSVYFDMTKLIYAQNFEKISTLKCLRKVEIIFQKKHVPIFASIRDNLLSNDYLYLVSKAIIISPKESKICFEERFAEYNTPFNVSILSKPGSGKLEVDDRFEFSVSEGFRIKSVEYETLSSDGALSRNDPISTFSAEFKNPNISEAKIFVEDSDRDSDDEMDADADF